MLKLSAHQMRQFSALSLENLHRSARIAVLDAGLTATQGWRDDTLRARVRYACKRGLRFGLETDVDVEDYVLLMMQFGPKFDSHPAVALILGDTARHPADRLDHLEEVTTDRVWDTLEVLNVEEHWHSLNLEASDG